MERADSGEYEGDQRVLRTSLGPVDSETHSYSSFVSSREQVFIKVLYGQLMNGKDMAVSDARLAIVGNII